MSKDSAPGKIFTQAYDEIEKIDFEDRWVTDEGYYDNINTHLKLSVGEMKATFDDFSKRRIILIGTRIGVIAVYDKYCYQGVSGIYHANVPNCKSKLLQALLPAATIGKRDMVTLIGSWNNYENNIGFKIEEVYKEIEELEPA
jgi:hypothetical protein